MLILLGGSQSYSEEVQYAKLRWLDRQRGGSNIQCFYLHILYMNESEYFDERSSKMKESVLNTCMLIQEYCLLDIDFTCKIQEKIQILNTSKQIQINNSSASSFAPKSSQTIK